MHSDSKSVLSMYRYRDRTFFFFFFALIHRLMLNAAARSIVLKGLCPVCAMSDFDVNDLVVVEPRTWPGINKPGGVGRVVAVDAKRKTCDVKYVLGGTEKDVAVEHLSSLEEAEPRPRRTTRSKSPAPRRRLRGDAPATATKPGLASERPSASAAAAAEPAVAWSSDAKAFGYACGFLISSIANTIAMKQTTTALPNYTLFVSFVHILVLTAVFFACATAPPSKSTPAERSFVMLGALDALAGVLVLLGSVHTSGTMQQLLLQMTIPLTILQS